MRATILNGPEDISLETVPDPTVGAPTSAVVEITHTGICGSDLHLYHGMAAPGTRPGHEFVGRVVAAGDEVRRFSVGDTVLVSGVVGCGSCPACLRGYLTGCTGGGLAVFGTGDFHGGQAEYAAVPNIDRFAMAVPPELDLDAAVMLTDILPTGYLGAKRADITPGDTVVVIGLGPVGMFALQSAQVMGAAQVIGVDMSADRRARAERYGAITVDPAAGTAAQVMELTKGRGADAAIEAVGSDVTINDAVMCVRPGATVSVVGVNTNMAMPYPMIMALMRDLTLRGTLASIPATWPELLPIVASGRIKPEDMVTHRLGLSEVSDAYRRFNAREDGMLKVVLDPTR